MILESAARMNNIELPADLDKILKPPNSEGKKNKGFMDLFRSKYLRLVSICFLCIWFTMNLVYYGLILNMNALGGNIYVNSVSENLFIEGWTGPISTRHHQWIGWPSTLLIVSISTSDLYSSIVGYDVVVIAFGMGFVFV